MIRISMLKAILALAARAKVVVKPCLALAFLLALMGVVDVQKADAQLPLGGGTLNFNSYEVEGSTTTCSDTGFDYITTYVIDSFSFTSSTGVVTQFPNASISDYVWTGNCQYGTPRWGDPAILELDGPTFTITFDASSYTVTYTANPTSIQGYINPKYVVVGVTYAPPGNGSATTPASTVQYTNTTSVGNTTTIKNSFSNDAGFSVSMSGSNKVSAGWFLSGDFTVTATESTDYTQGSSSSKTTTISKASTVAYQTPGTPTEAPVNSDYDYIWLWLNPELFTSYTPPVGSNPGSIVLTGYGMDPNDPATGLPQSGVTYTAGPDVIEVQVGCLNGHFSCGSDLVWNNGEAPGSFVTSGLLARSWQSAANGYYWPSGEQSGLSFNDVCQILTFDPLAITPYQCPTQNDYTLLNSLPSTTSDGRFSKIPYPPNPIQYPIGGANEFYNMVQTNTQSTTTENTTETKQAFSVSEQFTASAFFGLTKDTITFKESDTLTWDYSTLNTLTTTTTLTNALSITGPPVTPTYPGNEPVEYIGYQDNTFGTFVFVPVNYCPSGSILCTP